MTSWHCIVDGCENEVSESGHQCSACYRLEIETLIDEGRTKLHEVTQEIERAQQQLNDILLTADQAMSNQARAITAATFCCRFARVGQCRYGQGCRYLHERANRLHRLAGHGMQLVCDRVANHGSCYHLERREHP